MQRASRFCCSASWPSRPTSARRQPPPQEPPKTAGTRSTIEEEVVVTATRTGGRIDDQPTRVEVLTREEIEEKMLMTPGDIVMMLNEMGGMRVQTTSPSMGAASVRIQGMKGRYTRVLFDGLPLAGPAGRRPWPAADSADGSRPGRGDQGRRLGAVWRGRDGRRDQPGRAAARKPSRFARSCSISPRSAPPTASGSSSGGCRRQVSGIVARWAVTIRRRTTSMTMAGTTWRDIRGASFGRACSGTTRKGRSGWATVGLTSESRNGGVVDGGSLALPGSAIRKRSTRCGSTSAARIRRSFATRCVLTGRLAATLQRHDHLFGSITERDRHTNVFAEAAIRGARGRHTWVGGVAFERESFDPLDVPQFAYFHRVPGVFAQDDIHWTDWLTVSASARLDLHHTYGTFFSPRVAALVRSRRLDQPRLGRHRVFRVHAADRRDRSGRFVAPGDAGAARGGNRQELFDRRDPLGRPRVDHRNGVRLVGRASRSRSSARRATRFTNARSPGHQSRLRVAGDHAQGAVCVDRHLCVRAIARTGRRVCESNRR